ncbi:uncharacterized protein LOC142334303 [Lycorma delicatula]|uniref:uncharacterized protein LOC142334303 n=1 Tax=Lycorma delicatula TaxID=130591 RepID=UPI003F50F4E9
MKNSAAKKKRSAIGQRNVLATPYDKFWPLLDSNDADAVTEHLERLLPLAAIPKGFLTQKKLKLIFQEKDKAKRQELWKQKRKLLHKKSELELQNAKLYRKSLLLGVNCVTRGLEKSQVAACLISSDVSPRLIVNHVITLAARSGVTVLIVPLLKKITRTSLGVSCMAFALHTCITEEKENKFYPLFELIIRLGKKFSVPENLVTVNSSVNNEPEIEEDNDILCSQRISTLKIENVENKLDTCKFTYLHRSTTSQRVFKPPRPDIKLESTHLSFIQIEKNKHTAIDCHKRIRTDRDYEYESGDDDDDDDGNADGSNCEVLVDTDSLFFIDTRHSQECDESGVEKSKSVANKVNLMPPVVKKIRGNPDRKKIGNKS